MRLCIIYLLVVLSLAGSALAGDSTRYLAFQIFTGALDSNEIRRGFPPPPENLRQTVLDLRERIGVVRTEPSTHETSYGRIPARPAIVPKVWNITDGRSFATVRFQGPAETLAPTSPRAANNFRPAISQPSFWTYVNGCADVNRGGLGQMLPNRTV
jgi:hypothetical protein